MPSVSVAYRAGGGGPVMSVQMDGQRGVLSMVSTPPELSTEWGAARVDTVDRSGVKPLTVRSGPGLRKLSFEHVVWGAGAQGSVDHLLVGLRRVAEAGKRVRFYGAGWVASDTWWWVEKCSPRVEQMGDMNRANRVRVSWSLVEAVSSGLVGWSRTGAVEQPPVRIEAQGPKRADVDTSSERQPSGAGALNSY